MKTQEIEVAIKATVPVGIYCMDYDKIDCIEVLGMGSERNNLDGLACNVFRGIVLEEVGDIGPTHILKCQACLDACKK